MNEAVNPGPRNGILSLTIKDKSVLYAAYMPFIKNGGLFIPTNKSYKLGDEVFMLLNLMDEPEKIPVAGKVAWITPKGAQGNRPGSACSSTTATTPRAAESKPIWPEP
jgi:type IV pilus assembly protein PilZ